MVVGPEGVGLAAPEQPHPGLGRFVVLVVTLRKPGREGAGTGREGAGASVTLQEIRR